ncbi:MAG: dihydroorotase, partial [Cyanobacteria bacterium J06636_28]
MSYAAPPAKQPLIIQKAQVLLPSGEIEPREVAIADGKITAVGTQLDVPSNTQTLNGRGMTLLPGVIDPQVHFRDPGPAHKEDLFTASCACARGGVTSFLEMPNTLPPTTTQAALTEKLAIAASKSLVNYGFFIGATHDNLPDLQTATPTCGITLSMGSAATGSDSTGSANGPSSVATSDTIDSIFAAGDRLIAVHAEDQARMMERRQQYAAETDPA